MSRFNPANKPLSEIFALSETDQIRAAKRMRDRAEAVKERLYDCVDYQDAVAALGPDAYDLDHERLSGKTRALLTEVLASERAARELELHLYATTTREDLREPVRGMLDDMIEAVLPCKGDPECMELVHGLLYLSSYGGGLKKNNWGAARAGYEFNTPVRAEAEYIFLEVLHIGGLIGTMEDSEGDNLTVCGKAVLARLNERSGPSSMEKMMTVALAASSSSRPVRKFDQ